MSSQAPISALKTSDQTSAPCMWMRGGTSKGGFFLKSDLPDDENARNRFLLSIMGSPDPRQIDGMGGGDPLTSKIAIISKSERDDADVQYLFLQVMVDKSIVTDAQNCGNLLAGAGPFAIERSLINAKDGETKVRIFMENTGKIATATVKTPNGKVSYGGDATIDGVPGNASPVLLEFADIAGSTCGALLPSGNVLDEVEGINVTLIDNGMPTIVLQAKDMGISGTESRDELEANGVLRERLEKIRLSAAQLMNLGDVTDKTIPKLTMVSAPNNGGTINTRTFIPHRCHASIGVLGAVSVATACLLPGSSVGKLAKNPRGLKKIMQIEHPIGKSVVVVEFDASGEVLGTGILRTSRKLFDGEVFAREDIEALTRQNTMKVGAHG
ncbi:MAG: 4-oxalomesaconate tautomerase [Devosiaceae bacterium]|nr:4-oxalomesaconate tautomerase [Devosiaceae bacterium]